MGDSVARSWLVVNRLEQRKAAGILSLGSCLCQLHLMMLDIADALPLILEWSGRRAELQIPAALALLLIRRGPWHRSDGYGNRTHSDSNARDDGIGCGVDHRHRVRALVSHIGATSVWRDGYTIWS